MNGKITRMLMTAAMYCGFLLAVEPMGRLNDERIGPGGNTVVLAGAPTKFGCGLVTIHFDDQKPGTYKTLTIKGVTFTARNGKGFQIASLSRKNTSPPYALIIPQPEYVDLTFDPAYGTVTGIGVTQGLVSKNPASGDRSVFGYTTHFPNRWTSYPIPGYASLLEYQPSPPATEISFQIDLTSKITGWYDGVEQKTHFGYLRGVVDDGSFHGQPGLGYDGGTGSGSGAFFDDLTIERALGKAMPYRLNGNCKNQIDIIFMPDKKYGDPGKSFPTYYQHLSDLVEKGLDKNAVFKANKEKLNIYYLDEQATINYVLSGHCSGMAYAPSSYAGWDFDAYTGQGFGNAFSFADAAVILQPWMNDYGGYCPLLSGGNPVFHMYSRDHSIFFHEFGHAFFNLADEYVVGTYGTYWEGSPYPNIWDTKTECEQTAKSQGWDPAKCNEFYTGWWKIDPADAMSNAHKTEYGPACSRNAEYYFKILP